MLSAETVERLAGHQVCAAVSGGKDSAAMSLWLTEQGITHSRVFADTGWEAPETYAYLDVLRERLGPIASVRNEKLWAEARDGEGGMVTLIRRKQMFPSRTRRFCTEQLKLVPLKAHMSRLADDTPVINAIGIRAAESQARSKLTEWEWNDDFDCWTWRPLIAWSEQDVIDIHTRHGLAPNPLYLRGAQRAFFHLHDPANHASGFMPIERVREWARSDRGGRQMLLLDAPSEPGCMRWGLCEHLPADHKEGET